MKRTRNQMVRTMFTTAQGAAIAYWREPPVSVQRALMMLVPSRARKILSATRSSGMKLPRSGWMFNRTMAANLAVRQERVIGRQFALHQEAKGRTNDQRDEGQQNHKPWHAQAGIAA